jgi:hypothetical protein
MFRILTLVIIVSWLQPACEWTRPEASPPRGGQAPSSGSETAGKRKPPRKEKERRKRPVNLSRCLDSCAGGEPVLRSFCNDIENPVIQASCFSKLRESEQSCIGFCHNYFGK